MNQKVLQKVLQRVTPDSPIFIANNGQEALKVPALFHQHTSFSPARPCATQALFCHRAHVPPAFHTSASCWRGSATVNLLEIAAEAVLKAHWVDKVCCMLSVGWLLLQELEQRVYDIILMDVHMPVIDGLEASRRIRDTYPPEQRPKIVALSADTHPGEG